MGQEVNTAKTFDYVDVGGHGYNTKFPMSPGAQKCGANMGAPTDSKRCHARKRMLFMLHYAHWLLPHRLHRFPSTYYTQTIKVYGDGQIN